MADTMLSLALILIALNSRGPFQVVVCSYPGCGLLLARAWLASSLCEAGLAGLAGLLGEMATL